MDEMKDEYRILVAKPVTKGPRIWEDRPNSETNLWKIGCEVEGWMKLAQGHV
jgi:hypothetical protein